MEYCEKKHIFAAINFSANHNKDYSVVKTLSGGVTRPFLVAHFYHYPIFNRNRRISCQIKLQKYFTIGQDFPTTSSWTYMQRSEQANVNLSILYNKILLLIPMTTSMASVASCEATSGRTG